MKVERGYTCGDGWSVFHHNRHVFSKSKSAVLLIHVHQSYMYMCFNATLSFV